MLARDPVLGAGNEGLVVWVDAVVVVIAGDDEGGCDFAEAADPAEKAIFSGLFVDFFLAVDDVAGEEDIVRLALFGEVNNSVKLFVADEVAKVEVAKHENAKAVFELGVEFAVARKVKSVHAFIIAYVVAGGGELLKNAQKMLKYFLWIA